MQFAKWKTAEIICPATCVATVDVKTSANRLATDSRRKHIRNAQAMRARFPKGKTGGWAKYRWLTMASAPQHAADWLKIAGKPYLRGRDPCTIRESSAQSPLLGHLVQPRPDRAGTQRLYTAQLATTHLPAAWSQRTAARQSFCPHRNVGQIPTGFVGWRDSLRQRAQVADTKRGAAAGEQLDADDRLEIQDLGNAEDAVLVTKLPACTSTRWRSGTKASFGSSKSLLSLIGRNPKFYEAVQRAGDIAVKLTGCQQVPDMSDALSPVHSYETTGKDVMERGHCPSGGRSRSPDGYPRRETAYACSVRGT